MGGGERGCSFDPSAALLGSGCREARGRDGEGGGRAGTGHGGLPRAAPGSREKRKPRGQPQAGRAWEAARAGRRTKRLTRGRAAPPQETHGQARGPGARPAPAPIPSPAGRPGTRKVNH